MPFIINGLNCRGQQHTEGTPISPIGVKCCCKHLSCLTLSLISIPGNLQDLSGQCRLVFPITGSLIWQQNLCLHYEWEVQGWWGTLCWYRRDVGVVRDSVLRRGLGMVGENLWVERCGVSEGVCWQRWKKDHLLCGLFIMLIDRAVLWFCKCMLTYCWVHLKTWAHSTFTHSLTFLFHSIYMKMVSASWRIQVCF